MADPVKMTLGEVIMFGYFYERIIPLCEEFVTTKYRDLYKNSSPLILIDYIRDNAVFFSAIFDKEVVRQQNLKIEYFTDAKLRADILEVVDGSAFEIITDSQFDANDTFSSDLAASQLFITQ